MVVIKLKPSNTYNNGNEVIMNELLVLNLYIHLKNYVIIKKKKKKKKKKKCHVDLVSNKARISTITFVCSIFRMWTCVCVLLPRLLRDICRRLY